MGNDWGFNQPHVEMIDDERFHCRIHDFRDIALLLVDWTFIYGGLYESTILPKV